MGKEEMLRRKLSTGSGNLSNFINIARFASIFSAINIEMRFSSLLE